MLPLDLNSPRWESLEDAYGSAGRIPQLLSELEGAGNESLSELFGRICHQMSIYSSSIAAFPHLITAASNLAGNPGFQAEILCLAGAICESRGFDEALRRSEFAGALEASLPAARDLAGAALGNTDDQNLAIYLLKSIAAFGRRQVLARVLEGFANEEFTLECPGCTTALYVWPGTEGLFVAAEDPVTHKQARRTMVSPALSGGHGELQWLEEQSAASAGLSEIRARFPFLFGEASCPKCGHRFALFDTLADQSA